MGSVSTNCLELSKIANTLLSFVIYAQDRNDDDMVKDVLELIGEDFSKQLELIAFKNMNTDMIMKAKEQMSEKFQEILDRQEN